MLRTRLRDTDTTAAVAIRERTPSCLDLVLTPFIHSSYEIDMTARSIRRRRRGRRRIPALAPMP
jgi:hypothetical protein